MKKFLKLFLVFALIFTFSFSAQALEENTPENETKTEKTTLITSAPVVNVKGNNSSLILSWDKVENATSYVVYRSTNAKKGFKALKTVTTNTYTDKKLSYGKTYYYKVTAKGTDNKKTSSVVSKKVVPNKVTNVVLKPSSTSVKVTWNKVSTTGYYVYRSTDGKKWTKVATITKSSTTSYTDKKLKAKKTYYYQVQAYKKVGSKKYTGSKSTKASVKTLFTLPSVKVVSNNLNSMYVNIKKISDAGYYEVYTLTSKNGKRELYSTSTNEYAYGNIIEEYFYTNKPYVTKYFQVRACKDANYCSSFVTVSGQAKLSKPEVYGIKGGNKYATLKLSVNDEEDNLKVEIYRATSKKGKYTKVATKSIKDYRYTYTDKKVSNNRTYYYKVRLTTKIGKKTYKSSYSNILSVKTGKNAEITSAMNDAKRIIKESPMSKSMLVNYLTEYYGYTKTQATKGVDKAKFNFKANALKTAKSYTKYNEVVSEESLRTLLKYEGYTESEINYAISKITMNWHDNLVKTINTDLEDGTSKQMLLNNYANDFTGLTQEEVSSVIEELKVDFNNQAVIRANNYTKYSYSLSKKELHNILTEDYLFTKEEAEYAINNAKVDWVSFLVDIYYNDYQSKYQNYSKEHMIEFFTSDDYRFTEKEVEAAIVELKIDFKENARNVAFNETYSKYYSKVELIDTLEKKYHYTHEDAEYAATNSTIDYNYIALERALSLNNTNVEEVRTALTEYGFTSEEVEYAVTNISNN